ncbi:hypothetical protein PR048_029344 [Dryococelus australis]|uniref:Uncharacterized protein n=1 Tax=Dryococelus australis TaxID=614101 RepID=A0ABQ9GD49_9NEOP|nr:hypothetical protein PR048_029344 [Dryococelus australis]
MYGYYRIVRKRRRRSWDVHPINCVQHVDGAFHNLFGLLREDNEKFFNYLRMENSFGWTSFSIGWTLSSTVVRWNVHEWAISVLVEDCQWSFVDFAADCR